MRTKKFGYNTIATALMQIVTMAVGFIIPRILLKAYGSEINGLVTSITQFVGYFNIVEAGLGSAAVYALYKPLAERSTGSINSILSAVKRYYYLSGLIFVALVLALSVSYPFFVKTDVLGKFSIGVLVLVCGVAGTIDFFTLAKYRVLLTADQKVYVLSIASIFSIVLSTLVIAVLASYQVNIVTVKAAALSSVFLRSFILWAYVKSRYAFDYNTTPNKDALKQRWDALYLQVLGSIQNAAPIIIATLFTTLTTVSIYSIYNMVIGGIAGLLSIFISGLSASFGDVIAKNETSILQNAYQEFEFSYYIILSWVCACALILIMPFINIYTAGITDANYYIPFVGFLFVLNCILYNLKTPQGMLVISAGMFKETRVQTTIQGLIAVTASIIFVQYWGLAGVLLGSILSNVYRTVDLLFFVPRNITKLPVRLSLFRMARVFLSIAISVLPFIYLELNPSNYFQWTYSAILVSIYVSVVVIVINVLFELTISKNVLKRIMTIYNQKPV